MQWKGRGATWHKTRLHRTISAEKTTFLSSGMAQADHSDASGGFSAKVLPNPKPSFSQRAV
jgi:hypothetical protein